MSESFFDAVGQYGRAWGHERGRNAEYSGAADRTSSQLVKIGYTPSVKTEMVEEVHGNHR